MSNVSESIDWEHMPLSKLHRHRFIIRTLEGQTLDGWLFYESRSPHGSCCYDWDHLTEIIKQCPDGYNVLYPSILSINVLKETKR